MRTELRIFSQICSGKIDEFQLSICEIGNFMKTFEVMKEENEDLKKRVTTLECRLNDFEQYSRLNNIEIQGVPERKDENISNIVNKVVDALGVLALAKQKKRTSNGLGLKIDDVGATRIGLTVIEPRSSNYNKEEENIIFIVDEGTGEDTPSCSIDTFPVSIRADSPLQDVDENNMNSINNNAHKTVESPKKKQKLI
ncbi:unnamed protein product [Psylliodes chrysocephalus]|uniref:Uncharacterized protein n=1 Tax=Psylliodes chrysocephalus TaxID=3402493 RepID=A0A9P0GL88_9CUCU|nr:unnamed protein product [Psylliodes chrysocephala]